jgi:hypothetical protein
MAAPKLEFASVAEDGSAVAAAPFDPENPLTESPAPSLPENASLFQRLTYYVQVARHYKDQKLATLRPWREFADRDELSIPGRLEALSRISENVQYFNSNYAVVVSAISIYILITNVWFMVGMAVCAAAYYWVKLKAAAKEPIRIGSTELSTTQANFGLLLLSLFTFYVTNGSSTVFWLVTCAAIVVIGHASCRKPVATIANANPTFSFA